MAVQIVMDHTGDTRHRFDADDLAALSRAEDRFKALTGAGFTAAIRDPSGERPSPIHSIRQPKKHCSFRDLLAAERRRRCFSG